MTMPTLPPIDLMGADLLLADIDYFTYDHVTTAKTKKIPVQAGH